MSPDLPRDQITWHPTIDNEACIGDRVCIDFCKNDVFVWDEKNQRPLVESPLHCVVGCDSCAQICPVEAIRFPSKKALRETLVRLRAESKPQGGSAEPRD